MASKLSCRFYTVERTETHVPPLADALNAIIAAPHHLRQKQIGEGYVVRLERLSTEGHEICGEFVRVRDTNLPFEVRQDGVQELDTSNPLGDGIAFRFRPSDHTLAVEYDTKIISPGRIMAYLFNYYAGYTYSITPKMDRENWQKFQNSPVRKLKISISSPTNLGEIEPEGASVAHTFRSLGDAFDAPVITIEMGMGNRKGELAPQVKELAKTFWDLFASDDADLRSLRASVKPADGVPAEEINLIDEVLSDRIDVDYPGNNPDVNYSVRAQALKDALLTR